MISVESPISPKSSSPHGPWLAAWALLVLGVFSRAEALRAPGLGEIVRNLAAFSPANPYLLRALLRAFLGGWILAAAAGAGAAVLARLGPASSLTRLERLVLGAALGLGLLGLGTLALGAAGLWGPVPFWALLAAASVAAASAGRRALRAPEPRPAGEARRLGPWDALFWGAAALALGVIFLGDASPEIFYDSLHYHLGVPNIFRLEGRLTDAPLLCASLVMTVQMVWGFAATLGGPLAAKFLHGGAVLLAAAGLAALCRRFLSRGAAPVAAALFLAIPLVMLNAGTAGVDAAWAFFQTAAVLSLALALAEPAWAVTAGLLAGLSASCKFQGFPFPLIAGGLLVWSRREDGWPWPRARREALSFGAAALVPLAPYLMKNAFFHGNPLYPFLGTLWGRPALEPARWARVMAESGARSLMTELGEPSAALKLALSPWTATMEGRSTTDFLGPVPLAFLPALVFSRAPGREARLLRRCAAALFLLWLATTSIVRYLLPFLAVAAPLAADAVAAEPEAVWRSLRLGLLGAGVLAGGVLGLRFSWTSEGWKALGGVMSEEDYLAERHATYPRPPYEGIHWMNLNLPPASRVMFVGEGRSAQMERPVIPAPPYDPQPLERFAAGAAGGAEVAARLRAAGVSHLYLNLGEILRTESYRPFTWSPADFAAADEFWSRYLSPLWSREAAGPGGPTAQYVYKVLERPLLGAPTPSPLARWRPR